MVNRTILNPAVRYVAVEDAIPKELPLPEEEIIVPSGPNVRPALEPDETVQLKQFGGNTRGKKDSTQRGIDEDFFDYLARIDPKDWSSAQTSGLYIYKLQSGGNLRIGPVLRKAISFDELKDLAIKHGPGNYKVQFQTRLPHLTKCGEVVPFDADSLPVSASQRPGGGTSDMKGVDKAIEASSNMLEHSARTAIDLHKDVQVQSHKQPDIAALITAIGTLMPKAEAKEDKTTELLLVMLQNQAKDAERRAEAAEKRAEDQRRADREEADRREQRARDEANSARERDKNFFELMLKQAETKSDSLNQMTGLLTSFMKVKETIDDSLGGGPKGPWDLVAGVADTVLQQAPAIAAALKGAPPAQVAQMQAAAQNPQPTQTDQPFYDMVTRLAKYFGRDPQNYDGIYLVEMIENEYGVVHAEIFNRPKEEVLAAVAQFEPLGKAIMEHPQASVFMAKIVDAIKHPDTMEDIFPDEEDKPSEENPPMLHGKARRLNGKAVKHA